MTLCKGSLEVLVGLTARCLLSRFYLEKGPRPAE